MNEINASINLQNVSKLSTFELRQELVRRNILDIEESQINYKSMLQRLVKELTKEETELMEANLALKSINLKASLDEAKILREQKKQEAIERSRQRTQNSNYFTSKAELNKARIINEDKIKRDEDFEKDVQIFEEGDVDIPDLNFDPFRTKKGRSKIFVK